jgi:pimeloyl-ACP methyl ester carboxylesterase
MWRYVTDALGELGPHVVAADLPTMNSADATLADDVSHVRGIAQDGCGVLCGHSYGGAVITEAGATMMGLAHLVYLAAAMPEAGESFFDWAVKRPIPGTVPLEFDDDGTCTPARWAEDDGRYDSATLDRMRMFTLRPFAMSAAVEPLSSAAWQSVPSTYVVSARDSVLHADTQREMAARADRVIEVDSDHMVNLSLPSEIAELLAAITRNLDSG